MTKKKLLWLTSTYPLHDTDIEVPWMVAQIEHLSEFYDIEVVAPCYKKQGSDSIRGIKVHRFTYWFKNQEDLTYGSGMPSKIKNPFRWPVFLSYVLCGRHTVSELLKQNNYDYIIVNWPIPHLWWVPETKVPIVSKLYTAELVIGKKLPSLLNTIGRRSEIVVAISSYAMDTFKKYSTLHYYMTEEIIAELPKITPVSHMETDCFHILFVGRLIERKGVKYLIDAVKQIPDVRLHIVGDGMERANLEAQAAGRNNIFFYGRVSEEKLKEQYSFANIFILPAIIDKKGDTEGEGVVALESMQNKIPVIASNVGGIPDVVRDGVTGTLVPEKDVAALVKAIKYYKENPDIAKKHADAAYKDMQTKFSWNEVINKWKKLLI